MSKPLIGLSGSHIFDDHGTFALYPRAYVNHDYVQSILSAGGLPIILPFNEDTSVIQEMISHIDGLVLSGGHDVSPLLYGEEPLQGIGDVWPASGAAPAGRGRPDQDPGRDKQRALSVVRGDSARCRKRSRVRSGWLVRDPCCRGDP